MLSGIVPSPLPIPLALIWDSSLDASPTRGPPSQCCRGKLHSVHVLPRDLAALARSEPKRPEMEKRKRKQEEKGKYE